jgi:acyl-CoA thioesterase-1
MDVILNHHICELLMKDLGLMRKFRVFLGVSLLGCLLPLSAMANTTILLIGDSLSSGYGLQGPVWVEQVNDVLASQGHAIRIVNDSISGDTTAGGVARIKDGIDRVNPDWIIIELGGNDGLRGIPPKTIEQNLNKMVQIASANGVETMLLGIRIPPNYGRAYTEQFEQTFVSVSESTGSPLLPFFIGEIGGNPELNQEDMIHPNDQAQPIIRDRVVPFIKSVLGI